MSILKNIKDVLQNKAPAGELRSGKWPTVRKHHLESNPVCAMCGGKDKLEVHHIVPFHKDKEKELDPTNLITLCESKNNGVSCHLFGGHAGNYRSFNVDVVKDAQYWNDKIKNRP